MFLLGMVKTIHKTVDKSLTERDDAMVAAGNYSCIFGEREKAACDHALSAVEGLDENEVTVLLVYGAAHDFKKCVAEYKSTRLTYAGEIDCTPSDEKYAFSRREIKNLNDSPKCRQMTSSLGGLERLNTRLKEYPADVAARI